jgi:hypothetical protein
VGNLKQQRANKRAASQCDSAINGPKKLLKTRKHEGKRLEPSFSVSLPGTLRSRTINRSVEKLTVSFIVAAGSFSEMFTTYSHAFTVALASGLETRNQLRERQEKNEFNF